MTLGESLFHARKGKGLTQEEVAERLGVSRQTIGKWEADETLPDIRQSKRLAVLYGMTLDELIAFDLDVAQVEEAIEHTSEGVQEKIDWTSAWAKRYPILASYRNEVDVTPYARRIRMMLDELKAEYGYSELDAMLALKDILYGVWKESSGKRGR
ncbi:helix-turn-helix transcriptional regulator [Collinsella tanakaei]|uniref:helix-turn-helix transcriptional regulator n=1 Tax=Collinsella tanakaei TaxID=626935 RepID=UPI00195E859E|nr:helix-turn-helix transcriptional regulator [Collinsella tanakaei]MBM6755369.1 helix-turn-helix transcriptional regulator [Collinsella tanakaei]